MSSSRFWAPAGVDGGLWVFADGALEGLAGRELGTWVDGGGLPAGLLAAAASPAVAACGGSCRPLEATGGVTATGERSGGIEGGDKAGGAALAVERKDLENVMAIVARATRAQNASPKTAGGRDARVRGPSKPMPALLGSEYTTGGTVTVDGLGGGTTVDAPPSDHVPRLDHSPLDRGSALRSVRIVWASFASASSSRLMLSRVDVDISLRLLNGRSRGKLTPPSGTGRPNRISDAFRSYHVGIRCRAKTGR
jgi:hypothetical protein